MPTATNRFHDQDLALLDSLPGLPPGDRRAAIEHLVHNPSPAVREPASTLRALMAALISGRSKYV